MAPLYSAASTQEQLSELKTGGRVAESILKHRGQVNWSVFPYSRRFSSMLLCLGVDMLKIGRKGQRDESGICMLGKDKAGK